MAHGSNAAFDFSAIGGVFLTRYCVVSGAYLVPVAVLYAVIVRNDLPPAQRKSTRRPGPKGMGDSWPD